MSDQVPASAPVWRRHSDNASGHCLETLQRADGTVGIRNSRQPGLVLNSTGDEWHAFLCDVVNGESRRS